MQEKDSFRTMEGYSSLKQNKVILQRTSSSQYTFEKCEERHPQGAKITCLQNWQNWQSFMKMIILLAGLGEIGQSVTCWQEFWL